MLAIRQEGIIVQSGDVVSEHRKAYDAFETLEKYMRSRNCDTCENCIFKDAKFGCILDSAMTFMLYAKADQRKTLFWKATLAE